MSGKPSIVLVDDERIIVDSLRLQIRRLRGELEVECAGSVSEAWELLEELHADGSTVLVVISDWLMPVTRGDAFLDELKSKFPGIKRVLLTGQADEEALRRVRDRDLVDLMLHKPWSEQDIRDVMALVPPCDGP
ncbi:MAG TPA: response regulator [Polyangiaceae bacterium]|nr:response regulator [Polyangiaceae bacterium]